MYATDPTIAAELARAMHVTLDDLTHCVKVGTRNGADVYAVGWWSEYGYHSGTVPHDGTKFLAIRYGTDMDITR